MTEDMTEASNQTGPQWRSADNPPPPGASIYFVAIYHPQTRQRRCATARFAGDRWEISGFAPLAGGPTLAEPIVYAWLEASPPPENNALKLALAKHEARVAELKARYEPPPPPPARGRHPVLERL